MLTVSVAIACYKQDPFLKEALESIEMQDYREHIEISTFYDNIGIGTGMAFNKAIEGARGDIVVLLCSDDVFTDPHVISDIVKVFESSPQIGHVSRFYHQFVENDRHPVRAWRGENVLELANNPSGMAFRKSAIDGSLVVYCFWLGCVLLITPDCIVDSIGRLRWKFHCAKVKQI